MALARRRREFINRLNQAGGKECYNCRNCWVQRRIWNCSHWAISSRLNRSIAIFIGLSVGSLRKRIMISVTVLNGCKRNRRKKKEEIFLKTSSLISKQRHGSLDSHSVLNLRISCCRYLLLSTTKIGEAPRSFCLLRGKFSSLFQLSQTNFRPKPLKMQEYLPISKAKVARTGFSSFTLQGHFVY